MNTRLTLSLATALAGMAVHAQSVIFPQAKQAGESTLSIVPTGSSSTAYTLGNDLFEANFIQTDGTRRRRRQRPYLRRLGDADGQEHGRQKRSRRTLHLRRMDQHHLRLDSNEQQ